MEIESAIWQRRSVREYDPQQVADATLRHLVDAAIQAPSAMNAQPWAFTIVRDPSLLERLSDQCKADMLARLEPGAPQPGASTLMRTRLQDPAFHIFYHAPALVIISATADGPWITEDCALAAQNLMLAAFAAGLGTCWIGFAQRYLETLPGKQLLGIRDTWVPVAPIIVGHPRCLPAPVSRQEPILHWVG